MGFTTGFLGGVTLTYSLIYLSLYVHRSNRAQQSLLLNQQARLLTSIIDPPELEYDAPAYRIEKAGISEQFKDRWNREIEGLVDKVQTTDWEEVRIRWENRIGNVWNKLRNTEAVAEVEQRFKDNVIGTADQVKASVKSTAETGGPKRLLDL